MPPGFTFAVIAVAVILSAIVRMTRTGAAMRAVEEGTADAEALRDLTGIRSLKGLSEAFGPPRLDGVFATTPAEVRRRRRGLGYLLGDRWLDGASLLIAVGALLPFWPLWGTRYWLEQLVALAGLYQLAGWAATFSLLGRR
jgi:hypothetical protein